jgi:hypothetical protein
VFFDRKFIQAPEFPPEEVTFIAQAESGNTSDIPIDMSCSISIRRSVVAA